jgi:hypothetical protein
VAEKVFLPVLVTRPFRCEDCIARFNSWIWNSTPIVKRPADARSLVYQSPAAALHSEVYRGRKGRRKAKRRTLVPAGEGFARSIGAWMRKPTVAPKTQSIARTNAFRPREMPEPKAEFFPEILGVILEMKHEPS